MDAYLATSIAHDQVDSLIAAAAASRRAKEARLARRSRRAAARHQVADRVA